MSGKEKLKPGTTVIFHQELNEQAVTNLINDLDNIDEHINLYLTSPGGSIIYYRPLINYLNSRKDEITLIANWEISSGAFIVFFKFEGEKRILPNTTAMIHLTTADLDARDLLIDNSKSNIVKQKLKLLWCDELEFYRDLGLDEYCLDIGNGKDVHLSYYELKTLL